MSENILSDISRSEGSDQLQHQSESVHDFTRRNFVFLAIKQHLVKTDQTVQIYKYFEISQGEHVLRYVFLRWRFE